MALATTLLSSGVESNTPDPARTIYGSASFRVAVGGQCHQFARAVRPGDLAAPEGGIGQGEQEE
jgi:hypothetical protein